jgi:putative transposase
VYDIYLYCQVTIQDLTPFLYGIDLSCHTYYFVYMSRSLRIEYKDAWYHVMNRGARKMDIFIEDKERWLFLELLNEIYNKYQIEIHAYCLMGNHYHLLIKTPLANLSRAMQYLNGIYVQRYNKMYKTDGPLFRGRFKAVILDVDNYLLRLTRYIHLNPVKANLTKRAGDYLWSSCPAYLGHIATPDWLQTKFVLTQFGDKLQRQKYRLFLQEANDGELDTFFSKDKRHPVLGTEAFVTTVTEKYLYNSELSLEIPEQNFLLKKQFIELDDLIVNVSRYYQVSIDKLNESIRGKFNKPRSVAIYLATRMSGEGLVNIADRFSINNYSGVSKVASKIGTMIKQDANLRKEVEEIKMLSW